MVCLTKKTESCVLSVVQYLSDLQCIMQCAQR